MLIITPGNENSVVSNVSRSSEINIAAAAFVLDSWKDRTIDQTLPFSHRTIPFPTFDDAWM